MSFLKILIFKTKLKVLEKKQDLYHGLTCEASVSNRVIARKLVIPFFFTLVPIFLDELARKRLLRRLIMASRLLGAYNSRTKPQPSPLPPPPRVTPLLKRDLTNFESRDMGRESAIFRIKKYRIILWCGFRETLGTIEWRNGSENVALKMNLRSFGLCRDYSNTRTGEPSGSWISKNPI